MSDYIKVEWLHELRGEPVMLYSQLDHERNETGKVEVFEDGHMEWADLSRESGTTGLSEEPIPVLAEIGADSQFVPHEISAEEFEAVWAAAQNPGRGRKVSTLMPWRPRPPGLRRQR